MPDKFTFGSAGEIQDLEFAFARNGWTHQLLKKATGGDFFGLVREVAEGRAEICRVERLTANGKVVQDDRFTLVASFNIVVPENYDHATRLDSFKREHGSEFYHYDKAITDRNFGKATTKLVPGRKMTVKVFQITRRVTSEECLSFLKEKKAVLVGAQGASLAYEQRKNELPKGRWHISFDEKEALWKDAGGGRGVPTVLADSGGGFGFLLGCFGVDWHDGGFLLCFRDSESSDD